MKLVIVIVTIIRISLQTIQYKSLIKKRHAGNGARFKW